MTKNYTFSFLPMWLSFCCFVCLYFHYCKHTYLRFYSIQLSTIVSHGRITFGHWSFGPTMQNLTDTSTFKIHRPYDLNGLAGRRSTFIAIYEFYTSKRNRPAKPCCHLFVCPLVHASLFVRKIAH